MVRLAVLRCGQGVLVADYPCHSAHLQAVCVLHECILAGCAFLKAESPSAALLQHIRRL